MSAAIRIRGSARTRKSTIRTGDLVVDLKTRVVSVHDKPMRVTWKEYSIFELLSVHKGAIVTKQMLLDHLYDGMDVPELKIIDVFVCNLRKKLAQATGGNHYIETVWGRGYMLRDPAAKGPPGDVRDDARSSLRVGSHR
jgi:two-component system cell cycle response regulator CtrA